MATLEQNIAQAIADFDDIEAAIKEQGIDVPNGTNTSEYGNLIRSMTDGYKRGYDVGYGEGYEKGNTEGYVKGEVAGREAGYSEGYADGSTEYDRFWDAYQENGAKLNYTYAFAYYGWTDESFNPKYDICPANAQSIFYWSKVTRPEAILKEKGLRIDFSKATSLSNAFNASQVTEFGEINAPNCTSFSNIFQSSKIERVGPIKFNSQKAKGATAWRSAFTNYELTEISFEGKFVQDIGFLYTKILTVDSMKNIISCLTDFSGTDKEFTCKLTFTNECWANLEADSVSPNGNTWKEYCSDLGWNT